MSKHSTEITAGKALPLFTESQRLSPAHNCPGLMNSSNNLLTTSITSRAPTSGWVLGGMFKVMCQSTASRSERSPGLPAGTTENTIPHSGPDEDAHELCAAVCWRSGCWGLEGQDVLHTSSPGPTKLNGANAMACDQACRASRSPLGRSERLVWGAMGSWALSLGARTPLLSASLCPFIDRAGVFWAHLRGNAFLGNELVRIDGSAAEAEPSEREAGRAGDRGRVHVCTHAHVGGLTGRACHNRQCEHLCDLGFPRRPNLSGCETFPTCGRGLSLVHEVREGGPVEALPCGVSSTSQHQEGGKTILGPGTGVFKGPKARGN